MTTSKGTTPAPENALNRPALTNMQIRILAGIPWLAGALFCLVAGEWPWAIFITLGAVAGVLEFYGMAHGRPEQPVAWVGAFATVAIMIGVEINQTAIWLGAVVAAAIVSLAVTMFRSRTTAVKQTLMTLAGLVYVAFPLATTEVLRREIGVFGVLLAIFITVGTDTFAYFGGRLWGKRPLAPRISPKKTVEGLYCGLIGGAILTAILMAMSGGLYGAGLLIPLFGPPLAVIGDLLESALKRHYQVKDSHLPRLNIIPGHGGVLDRADSLLLVAPFVTAIMALVGML
jgi:phosphatidate cytidylyltransferase